VFVVLAKGLLAAHVPKQPFSNFYRVLDLVDTIPYIAWLLEVRTHLIRMCAWFRYVCRLTINNGVRVQPLPQRQAHLFGIAASSVDSLIGDGNAANSWVTTSDYGLWIQFVATQPCEVLWVYPWVYHWVYKWADPWYTHVNRMIFCILN